jgi:hypothetical protein
MSKKEDFERAALASLLAVASDGKASPAARVAAGRAVLEHLARGQAAPGAPRRSPAAKPQTRSEAELRDELAELRRKRAIEAFR